MRRLVLIVPIIISLILFFKVRGDSQDVDCLMCHGQFMDEKVVHPALHMGCPSCHTGIDAREIPHKKKNKNPRGLSSTEPEICYQCHDKSKFTMKSVHPALMMGCTSCHNPHSSKNEKILKSPLPDLCYNCHDKNLFSGKKNIHMPVMGGMCTMCHNPHSTGTGKLLQSEPPDLCYNCHDKNKFTGKFIHAPVGMGMCTMCHTPHQSDNDRLLQSGVPDLCYNCHDKGGFSRQNIHMPVMGGMCMSCHKPHISEEMSLLKTEPVEVCLECHGDLRKRPHAVSGFSSAGHPVGLTKKGRRPLQDPVRAGKVFYCGSCHNPHSSDYMRLFRYEARSAMGICIHCHKM